MATHRPVSRIAIIATSMISGMLAPTRPAMTGATMMTPIAGPRWLIAWKTTSRVPSVPRWRVGVSELMSLTSWLRRAAGRAVPVGSVRT
jgi:hypothetical protein